MKLKRDKIDQIIRNTERAADLIEPINKEVAIHLDENVECMRNLANIIEDELPAKKPELVEDYPDYFI